MVQGAMTSERRSSGDTEWASDVDEEGILGKGRLHFAHERDMNYYDQRTDSGKL